MGKDLITREGWGVRVLEVGLRMGVGCVKN